MTEPAEGVKSLEWDSVHFGFRVGGVTLRSGYSRDRLEGALRSAEAGSFTLVYVFSAPEDPLPADLLERFGGRMLTIRVRYRAEVAGRPVFSVDQQSPDLEVSEVHVGPAGKALRELALQAGAFSRFRIDPQFPQHGFRALYEAWIERSTQHEVADAVLVAGQRGALDAPLGVITLSASADRGEIGLVAVAESCRGRGIGSSLLRHGFSWFAARGVSTVEVVTQAENRPACALYEKAGFVACRWTLCHHFWLRPSWTAGRSHEIAGGPGALSHSSE